MAMLVWCRVIIVCAFGLVCAHAETIAPSPPTNNAAVANYINSITNFKARFEQIAADGTISYGTVYIRRPGRARFEYDPPAKTLIVAGGGQVAIFDLTTNTLPQQFPLRAIPLAQLLAKDVDLSQSPTVVFDTEQGEKIGVSVRIPEHPERGELVLFFQKQPIVLTGWVFIDQAGQKTTLLLGTIDYPETLPSNLFNVHFEIMQRGLK